MELLVKFFGFNIIQKFCDVNMEDFFDLIWKIEIVKREVIIDEIEIVKIDIFLFFFEIYFEICKFIGLDCFNKVIEDVEL